MTILPVADARANLSKLIDEASTTHERIEITKNGRRAAVLMGADDYDAMRETIAVLSDSELVNAHLLGLKELASGEFLDADALTRLVKQPGRHDESK